MQTITLTCPVCQASGQKDINLVVSSSAKPEIKEKIISGQLFIYECYQCGAKRQININFIYYDPNKKFLTYLLPDLDSYSDLEKEQMVEKAYDLVDIDTSQYQLRIVKNSTELVEKIHIIERGYTDLEVELVKLLTDGLFNQEKPECTIINRFFYTSSLLQEAKIIYLTDDEAGQYMVDFNMELLDFVQNKFKKILTQNIRGEFRRIDLNWATNVIEE